MNKNMILGWVALVIVVAAGVYFYSQTAPAAPAEQGTATSTEPIATSSDAAPGESAAAPHKTAPTIVSVPTLRAISIDQASLTATSSHPTITGTSNLSSVGLLIYNSEGVGIVANWTIAVSAGHWSYTVPLGLKNGTYTVQMVGADNEVKKTLTVK